MKLKPCKCGMSDKNGRWILDDEEDSLWQCPECELLWIFSVDGPEENEAYFCPRCGVRLIDREGA